jgi:2-polyprenyl-3-methyl-5-hydroxy-6-metoxy-1,4-benzoquinol methylase
MNTSNKDKDSSAHERADRQLFDQIAEQYIRKDTIGSSKFARKLRLESTLSVANLNRPPVILEVGCGGGFTAEYLAGKYSKFYGVDYSSELIDYARRSNYPENATFFVENIKDFTPPEPVDVIVMIGVLHHLVDIPQSLELLFKMLKPGGILVANEPQPKNPFISLARAIRKRVDHEYSEGQVELSVEEMRVLYSQAGFKDVNVRAQGFLSTPFAEVIMSPQWIARPISKGCCLIDIVLGKLPSAVALYFSWNAIVLGRRPE